MADSKELVVVISRGMDDERSSVAWSIANSGLASGFKVLVFLVSSGVDWVRKGGAGMAHPNPADPSIGDMIENVREGGGAIKVCPPCAKGRGYAVEDLEPGVELAGAPSMLEWVARGAEVITL